MSGIKGIESINRECGLSKGGLSGIKGIESINRECGLSKGIECLRDREEGGRMRGIKRDSSGFKNIQAVYKSEGTKKGERGGGEKKVAFGFGESRKSEIL